MLSRRRKKGAHFMAPLSSSQQAYLHFDTRSGWVPSGEKAVLRESISFSPYEEDKSLLTYFWQAELARFLWTDSNTRVLCACVWLVLLLALFSYPLKWQWKKKKEKIRSVFFNARLSDGVSDFSRTALAWERERGGFSLWPFEFSTTFFHWSSSPVEGLIYSS